VVRRIFLAVIVLLLAFWPVVEAQRRTARYCVSCPRDSHGRIKRSAGVVGQFKRATGYPKGRPGYEVHHVVPLSRGGCDCAGNLQWLSKSAHRMVTRGR
jgi:hypothetical protein